MSKAKWLNFYPLSSILYPPSSILHLLLLWLLTLPAITPLLHPTLTRSADGLLHLYRIVALDHLIRQGVFFSRWLPDLAYGYGLPLFIFYAPLSYYLTEALHLLGLDMVAAFNASAALALLVAGTGIYLWVKDMFGPKAGLLAGLAYVYAPYQLFNIFARGSLPVTWAGALFPFAFWAFGRLIRQNRPGDVPLAALALAAALLLHNISNLLFLPILLLYLAIELLQSLRTTHYALRNSTQSPAGTHYALRTTQYPFPRIILSLTLGLALAAFFWLPATLEKDFVQVQRVITPPDFDYRSNFVSLNQLFSLPPAANTGLLNPADPLTLGLAQVGLAVIGLLAWLIWWRKSRNSEELEGTQEISPLPPCPPAPLLFTSLGLACTLFMMLPISVGVWDSLPLIAFVQQPDRLLSVTALLLAVLAGAGIAALPGRWGFGLLVTGIILIFFSAVPLLYPRYYEALPAPPTLNGMMAYEKAVGAIGTTSFGEYLPIWVQQTPHESPLEPLYQSSAPIERLDRAYLPATASVEAAIYGVNQVDLTINIPQPSQAVFHTFYFPGWQAAVDGQPTPVAPVTERGLIGVPLPAGQHHLHLTFTETPIRLTANGLSLLALAITIFLTFKPFYPPSSTFHLPSSILHPPSSILHPPSSTLHPPQFISLTALALILILTKTLYLDHYDNPLKRVFNGTAIAGADVSRQVNFGHQLNLLGYDLPTQTVAAGQAFDLTLYWQARQPLTTNYSALAQLVDEQQHLYGGQDNLHPGNLPTSRWEPWGFARDPHMVRVPPGTPPGDYFLVAGPYDPATWARLLVVEGGDPSWNDVIAIPVKVVRPARPPALAELGIVWRAAEQTSDAAPIRLLGAAPEREVIQRSDFLRIALFWEALETPPEDYQISLRLVAADGLPVLSDTSPPSFGRYPTSRWATGERVRDNHAFWIPADFPTGVYGVQAQLLDGAGQPAGDWLELGKLRAE